MRETSLGVLLTPCVTFKWSKPLFSYLYHEQWKGRHSCPDVRRFSWGLVMHSDSLDGRTKNPKGNKSTCTHGLWSWTELSSLPQLCDRSLCGQQILSLPKDASYNSTEPWNMRLCRCAQKHKHKMLNPSFQALRNARLKLGCLLNWVLLAGVVRWSFYWRDLVWFFYRASASFSWQDRPCPGIDWDWALTTQDCSLTRGKVSHNEGGRGSSVG